MARVPVLARRDARLERRDARLGPGGEDARHVHPVLGDERSDRERLHHTTVGERAAFRTTCAIDGPYAPAVDLVRPTADRLDEALTVLQASEVAVYGDSDWTAHELREEWEKLDVEQDAWVPEGHGRDVGARHAH